MSSAVSEKTASDFKVGILTFLALALLIFGITFAGGDKGLFFTESSLVKALLIDIGGLKVGAPVTMGGLSIGQVSEIDFTDRADGTRIEITMRLREDIRKRIKTDSVPSIRTQGMMGDRYVDISMGSPDAKVLPEGTFLMGTDVTEFDQMVTQATSVLREMEKLIDAVNRKQGAVGQFFYDQTFYDSLTETLANLNSLVKDFKENPKRYVKLKIF